MVAYLTPSFETMTQSALTSPSRDWVNILMWKPFNLSFTRLDMMLHMSKVKLSAQAICLSSLDILSTSTLISDFMLSMSD